MPRRLLPPKRWRTRKHWLLLRRLQIGPYAFLRESGWRSIVQRIWPWLAASIALLLLWAVYTVHVEHLVQRRTRELRAALAERRELEMRMRNSQQQMEHLSRLSILGELAGRLAHELNQPLAAITNYSAVVSASLQSDPRLRDRLRLKLPVRRNARREF